MIPTAAAIKIAPLTWSDESGAGWKWQSYHLDYPFYAISRSRTFGVKSSTISYWVTGPIPGRFDLQRPFNSLEDAQSAAQADWDQFIRSALVDTDTLP